MRFATVCTLAFAICGKANRDKLASFSEGAAEDLEHRFGQETNFEDHLSPTMNMLSIPMRQPTSETSSSSGVRKLAAILALNSALTSADALALHLASAFASHLGVRPSEKNSNTSFAPIHTNNPLHGTPSGPLHASIIPFDGEAITQMVDFVNDVDAFDDETIKQMFTIGFRSLIEAVDDADAAAAGLDVPLHASIDPFDDKAIKEMVKDSFSTIIDPIHVAAVKNAEAAVLDPFHASIDPFDDEAMKEMVKGSIRSMIDPPDDEAAVEWH